MSWVAPPLPDEGVISWNVNTACNYRCSYCSQRFKDDRGRWSQDTPRFLEAFSRLPGRWEIKLSGGEPFVHPTLLDIVAGLADLGHRISMVTNLSARESTLSAFVEAARGRVGTMSCSLHLEYVAEPSTFALKARRLLLDLQRRADPTLPTPSLCVTTVATKTALPRLESLSALFADSGLSFKVQPERQDAALIAYAPSERSLLASMGGHNATGALAHDFLGRPCWAGARYFVMDDRGEAYRCYPARRTVLTSTGHRGIPDHERQRRLGYLGNFLTPSFRLLPAATVCLYRHCYCTVPISRGMMARQAVEKGEAE